MRPKRRSQKPSELLSLYSRKLTSEIDKKLSPLALELNFQYRSPHIGHISGFVIFRTGWMLEFDEIIQQERTKVIKRKYRYHLMDRKKQLIFRYDNVPHFPKIKSYPHHKHLKDKVIESNAPDLLEVIDEVETLIVKTKN